MTGFYFFPRNIYINMAQNSADSGLNLIMGNWRRYAYILHTLSKGVLCTFPALSFYCTQLLNQSITCLTALIYDSIFLKLRCITLIYLLRVFIILMVCSWPFKKILMSCVLFKGCNNSPVSTPAIPSTKVLQVWKNMKLEFILCLYVDCQLHA